MKIKRLSFGSVVVYIFLLLLVALVVGFIAKFTNGFTDNFKTFYVEQDGKVFATTDNATFNYGTNDLKVGYTFSFLPNANTPSEYTVKILANSTDENAFTYTVDGVEKQYVDNLDLTNAFNVEATESGFTFEVPLTMLEVLEAVNDGEVVVADSIDLTAEKYFKLVVISQDESSVVNIVFNRAVYIESIKLDTDNIIFGG